jgi:uncharacterized membrane protein
MNTSPRRWKTDLFLVVAGAVAALAATLVSLPVPGLQTALVLPLVVLLPGYALIAALFPERRSPLDSDDMARSTTVTEQRSEATGLLFSVRVALSVAASLALVAGVALVVTVAGLSFDAPYIPLGVFGLTLALTAVAFGRRAVLSTGERAGFPPLSTLRADTLRSAGSGSLLSDSSAFDESVPLAANVVVVVGLLVFVSSVGLAFATTHTGGPQFTEVALVTQNESGDYVADDYPRTLDGSDTTPVTVAIENHEGSQQQYTVVTQLARVDRTANGTTVTDRTQVSQNQVTVSDGETAYVNPSVEPAVSGTNLRLSFFVYQGDRPANPTRENAYRVVQLNVQSDGGGSNSLPAPEAAD